MPDPQTKPKKLVKVKDVGVIAFPGHFDDSQIIAAIRAHKASPLTTEESEHARQLKPARSLHSVIDPIDQALAPSGPPTSNLEAAVYAPKEGVKGAAAMTVAPALHPLDTAKSLWEQAKQFMPAYANTAEGFPVPVPNLDTVPAAMQLEDQFKQHPEYMVGSFVLPAALAHGMSAKPLAEPTSRFATRVTSSNPMGEVRVGPDNVPSVWLSPKGWDHWMKAFAPGEKGTIPGMSIRADQAAEGMFNSKINADPEWLHVQKLLGDAHAQANGGNAMNMLRADPSKVHAAFNVLPEEAAHSWQRIFSKNGFLQTHLPNDAWQRTAAKVPSPMKARLAADGYNVNRPSEIVAETAAKFITGDLQGTDPGQAAEFLDHYFKEVTDVHGPEALTKLEQTRQATEQLQKDIYAEHQQSQQGRPSAGVPSVAAGRQGRAPEVSAGQAGAAPAADLAFSRGNVNRFPNPDIRQGTEEFTRKKGRRLPPPMFAPPDTRAIEIADAYSQMKHDPANPKVKASYDALKKDIDEQWDLVHKLGIKPEPWTREGQPYKNSYEMMKDVRDNKHIWFFQGGDMPADHPLSEIDPETGLTSNDKLRVVHDVFGHAKEGFQFGGRGEENAWLAHQPVFSKEALPALTTETKGQNSWVNYGPHMRDAQGNIIHPGQPGHLAPPDRPYAEQKAGILPERFLYRSDAPVSFMSPNLFTLDMAKAGGRLASQSHKMFSGISDMLSRGLGVSVSTEDAIGHWQGGAENSVMHHFPLGTDRDTVLYHGAIMGKVARQNYYGAFFPDYSGEGPDRMYAFWVDGSNANPDKIASVLEKHNISGSTIEPAEGGHTVFVIGEGERDLPKVDKVTTDLGVKHVEQYEGKREFIGNKDRDAAERDYSSTIEALESKHPEWRQIREGLESRPDYRALRAFSEHAERVAGTPEEARIVDDNLFRRHPDDLESLKARAAELGRDLAGAMRPVEKIMLPPTKGYVRLYRAESPTTKFGDVFNAEKLNQYGFEKPPIGTKSFTSDPEYADYYRQSYGKDAKVYYMDVPQQAAEAALRGNGDYVLNPDLFRHDVAFKRDERFPTEGWYTADGKFRANAHYGQHKTTAIKYKLGKNYDEAWANGHIRVSKNGPNHWGLEAGRNDSNTRERLAEAIQKLPENAWTITIEAFGEKDPDGFDSKNSWSSFKGPSARIEALEWVEGGMKKEYGRGMGIGNLAYAFKRESVGTAKNEPTTPIASNDDILTRLKAEAIAKAPATVTAGVLGLSALRAEAEKRKPSAIVK